jgi:hypothetical protein
MPVYLYRFGFESPTQFRNNASYGWDDEDSQGVLIEAGDEAAALAWGQAISERFIQLLFHDDAVSWREMGFANWLEPPGESWPESQSVTVGQFPDFAPWLGPYEGGA